MNIYENNTKQYNRHITLMIKISCLITALIYAPEIEFEHHSIKCNGWPILVLRHIAIHLFDIVQRHAGSSLLYDNPAISSTSLHRIGRYWVKDTYVSHSESAVFAVIKCKQMTKFDWYFNGEAGNILQSENNSNAIICRCYTTHLYQSVVAAAIWLI